MRRSLLATCLLATPAFAMADLNVVVIEGLGGSDIYKEQFANQVARLDSAARSLTDDGNVRVFRSGDFEREDITAHFGSLSERLGAGDRLAVFLVGHGSYDDHEYKFNIAGPDLTDTDLLDMLDAIDVDSQLLVNTSSASGATFERLQADGRALILATKSGVERHATRFGHYFSLALTDPSADLDKNEIVTAEEAFRFAERQVADFYERNGQLATEHPRLEGGQAARFSVARLGVSRPDTSDEELQEMIAERDRLNAEIDGLRQQREAMNADAYQSALLERMLQLATLEDRIEAREADIANER